MKSLLDRSVLIQVLFAGVTVFLKEFLLLIFAIQPAITGNTNRHYSLASAMIAQ